MFDSLKKRLKEALNKATAVIGKEEKEKKPVSTPSEIKETEKIATPEVKGVPSEKTKTADEPRQKEKALEDVKEAEETSLAEKEIVEEEIRTIEETAAPKQVIVEPQKPEKKSILRGLIKRVVEKKLSEGDVGPVIKELRNALLENDVALETAEQICFDVKAGLVGKDVSRGRVEDAIRDALRFAMLGVMKQERIDIGVAIKEKGGPYVIMFFGFNGVGKTTTIAKFAHRYKKYKPVIAAGDTFRAASIEQLEEHSHRLQVELVKHRYGADSAAVIFDAIKHAAAEGSKLVLADTAGRSHSNANLMDELKKVVRVNKPDMKILILDSLTGNDIYDQTRLFNEAVGVDAIILTKADVYQKGGAALSAAHTINKPILFLGTGQNYEDLKEFDAEEIVKNLLE